MDKLDQDSKRILFKVALDVACLLFVGFPILLFYILGSPYERGFFCDDESLKHPYKDNTVPPWTLYVFGLGFPIAAIFLTEYYLAKWSNSQKNNKRTFLSFPLPDWLVEVYRHVGVFGFGAACSQLTTDIAKYTIGRLRPHFFAVCNPTVDCNDPSMAGVYVQRFQCRNANERLIKDMRLSFPSGHSSFSMYCMVFLAMYLQAKMTWKGSKLLKHAIQYLALVLAAYTALTRISDYKHHWSDVLFGVLLGVLVAIVTVAFVSDLFPSCKPSSRDSVTSNINANNIELPEQEPISKAANDV